MKHVGSERAIRDIKDLDIPAEKRAALKLLDGELSKQISDKDDFADNQLEQTLNWLRKRQNDTIALENRQVCRLYDIDILENQMKAIEENSQTRGRQAEKVQSGNTKHNRAFGHDVPNQDIQAKIVNQEKDLKEQKRKLNELKSNVSAGFERLGMEPDQACRDAYDRILAREIQLN